MSSSGSRLFESSINSTGNAQNQQLQDQPAKQTAAENVVDTVPWSLDPEEFFVYFGFHLYVSQQIIPKTELMRGIFKELISAKNESKPEYRLQLLTELSGIVHPDNILNLFEFTCSRRLVLFSLSFLWDEKQTRAHAQALFNEMLRNLSSVISYDQNDLILWEKEYIFRKIIRQSRMDQVISFSKSLMNAKDDSIVAQFGLFVMRNLLERASSQQHINIAAWKSVYIPKFVTHLLKLQDELLVFRSLGATALKHILTATD